MDPEPELMVVVRVCAGVVVDPTVTEVVIVVESSSLWNEVTLMVKVPP
jgi:hypothetical protein